MMVMIALFFSMFSLRKVGEAKNMVRDTHTVKHVPRQQLYHRAKPIFIKHSVSKTFRCMNLAISKCAHHSIIL